MITHRSDGIETEQLTEGSEEWRHSHETMFSKDGERKTARRGTPKSTAVIGKEVPSQRVPPPLPLAPMWGHVTSSGQWNESKSGVCPISGLSSIPSLHCFPLIQ